MILPDYHIHTRLCNHAEGEMEEYVERAIEAGLTEIGFSDHMPVMPEADLCMSYDELPWYVDRVHELRDRNRDRISIRLGCEMDIEHDRLDEIRDIIGAYPFDYIIGSIHYLDGWPFDQEQYSNGFELDDLVELYARFFDGIIRAAETGLFDVVGHIDNIKCMGYRPTGAVSANYERVAAALKNCNLVVEINTSGFDKPCGEQYPSDDFLAVLRSYDIPVTVGSDSHSPGHVGRHYERALSLLDKTGYDNVVYFENRNRIMKPLRPSGSSHDTV